MTKPIERDRICGKRWFVSSWVLFAVDAAATSRLRAVGKTPNIFGPPVTEDCSRLGILRPRAALGTFIENRFAASY